jgi:hypothetical protein
MTQTRRHKWWTAAAALGAAIAAAQLGARAVLWFLPYHWIGLLNELGLLAIACLIGLGLFLLLRRRASPPPLRLAATVTAVVYLLASSAGLGWSSRDGLGLGVQHYVLFSTADCDFTARFARPPQYGRVRGVLSLDDQAVFNVAVLADVGSATAFRAECMSIPGNIDPSQVAQILVLGQRRWIEQTGLQRADTGLRQDARGPVLAIDGEIRGSVVPQAGQPGRTLVGLRSYIGPRSVMTVYVFQPQGEALSAEASAFLDGVQRK